MKKIASILLLGILLFNCCGYRWVINRLQQTADIQLEARLDVNDYDESQLIEIKIPINMPYQTDWANFERYDGEIELNGIHYKYVKRKIEGGQLILKCIANQTKQHLEIVKNDFFKIANDLQQDQPNKKSGSNGKLLKNASSDYDAPQYINTAALINTLLAKNYNQYQSLFVPQHYQQLPQQPPEA